jgi:hypothetical protein
MNNHPIDWRLLSSAVEYYKNCGYHYVEVPWLVHESVNRMTLPRNTSSLKIENKGSLIGSAEQGILSLVLSNQLERGKYVACSPCFRNEPHLDKYHQTYFMKVELYNDIDVNEIAVGCMIHTVEDFLTYEIEGLQRYQLIHDDKTNEIDILLNGIEIGSYGIRTINGHSWVYGTGLALPRLTLAMETNNEI